MEVTEKWLGEIGGWAALKAARGLVDAGLVTVQSASDSMIRGLAGSGKTKFAAGLRIRTRTDVDNLCTCPTGRRGSICEHSLAVALAWVKAGTSNAVARPSARPAAEAVVAPAPAPRSPILATVPGRYFVFLPEAVVRSDLREPVAVYVRYEAGGEPETSALVSWLAAAGVGAQSAPLSVRGEDWKGLLASLPGHPRIAAGKPSAAVPVAAASDAVPLPIIIEQVGEQEVLVRLQSESHQPLTVGGDWWICRETKVIFRVPVPSGEGNPLLAELTRGNRTARRTMRWLVGERAALGENFQVELAGEALAQFHVAPVQAKLELQIEGSLQSVEMAVWGTWNEHRWNLLSNESETKFPIHDQSLASTFYVRDRHGESRFLATLAAMGFTATAPHLSPASQALRLNGSDAVLAFFATHLPRLEREHRVVFGDRWRTATRGVGRIVPQVRAREEPQGGAAGGEWLTMEFAYEAPDGFRLPRSEVLRLVRSGQRTVQGKAGRRYLIDLAAAEQFEETLRDVPLQLTPDGAKISSLHASYFLPDAEAAMPELAEEEQLLPALGDLGSKLRPYQMLGVRWMRGLASIGRGGVLGDEMGLGKTVQSIALVKSLMAGDGADTGPILVVCPKSLIGNWVAEFEKFAPGLRTAAIRGADRVKVLETIAAFDVLITSYQLVVRDLKWHLKYHWRLLLLDEASYIRNPDTEAAKALRQLQAATRLALTGTPVENSVRDLWSIYHFLLPGLLGSRDNFKERFEQPIQGGLESPAGQAASERLKKLLRPYFLRRTKREVLRDLPEKIEQILWCEPSQAQMEVYRRLLEEGREEIKAARRRSGQNGAKMTMFTVLLRLRQACCDLRLTGLQEAALRGLERDDLSGKWPMIEDTLAQIVEGGGKVLIFSQFVQYLRLVREHVEAAKMAYCYLDGSSQDREAQVIRFQTDPAHKVFLISLKAGGYGLNLTAADHVVLLDPWWNPAVEAQAIDRAHRIGQQRVVNAYRLAIRGTVEERILSLQARKRGLIEAALDEQSPLMSGLQAEDLEQLIE